jgi:hypothetical protein
MPILLPYHENFSIEDHHKWLGTTYLSKYWTRISGTGTATFNVLGITFTGVSTWVINTLVPVEVNQGFFANFTHQQTAGAATVAVSAECFNSSKASLGIRNCFFTGTAPTTATNVQAFITGPGSAASNYIAETYFIKIRVTISANTGTYTLQRPYFDYMDYAQRALYV